MEKNVCLLVDDLFLMRCSSVVLYVRKIDNVKEGI